jgi:hypothetical protein
MKKKVKLIIEYYIVQEEDETEQEFEDMIQDFMSGSSKSESGVDIDEFFDNVIREDQK